MNSRTRQACSTHCRLCLSQQEKTLLNQSTSSSLFRFIRSFVSLFIISDFFVELVFLARSRSHSIGLLAPSGTWNHRACFPRQKRNRIFGRVFYMFLPKTAAFPRELTQQIRNLRNRPFQQHRRWIAKTFQNLEQLWKRCNFSLFLLSICFLVIFDNKLSRSFAFAGRERSIGSNEMYAILSSILLRAFFPSNHSPHSNQENRAEESLNGG